MAHSFTQYNNTLNDQRSKDVGNFTYKVEPRIMFDHFLRARVVVKQLEESFEAQ